MTRKQLLLTLSLTGLLASTALVADAYAQKEWPGGCKQNTCSPIEQGCNPNGSTCTIGYTGPLCLTEIGCN